MEIEHRPGKKPKDVTVFSFSNYEVETAMFDFLKKTEVRIPNGKFAILYPDRDSHHGAQDLKVRIEHDADPAAEDQR